jgi:ubiquinone/menaquinone biosynthesis C-methylase UbiE
MPESSDRWAAGPTYEDFMGRWSRLLAPRFVAWLSVRPAANWLDVGCGTGALADAICAGAEPASVVACDPSEPFIEYARRRQDAPRVSFVVAGVGQLPTRPGGFDSVTSLLALNFFPDPEAAIHEMRRITAVNGLVSACVWDYADRMEFLSRFWDSVRAVDPSAVELDEGRRFPICRPDALESLFREAGFAEVLSDSIEIPTRFATFAEFWKPFLGGTGPGPSYVATLDPPHRDALATRLERSLPRERNGAISLVARAWVVRGVVH